MFRRYPPSPFPYAPTSPEGLAARWLQWVVSMADTGRHPLNDSRGRHAGRNQPSDVWFLAGTFGGTVRRTCEMPAGTPIFLPAFNMWHWFAQGPPPPVPRSFGTLTVDGTPLELEVIATPIPFDVKGVWFNPVTRGPRRIPMTIWGRWRRIDPLPPGEHIVEFHGGDGHSFEVGARYLLTVS
jgi:hypothetical protein